MALQMLSEILALPFELSMRVLEALEKEADKQMLNTVESIRERMIELQLMHDLNKISQKEYDEAMKFLENKLRKLVENL